LRFEQQEMGVSMEARLIRTTVVAAVLMVSMGARFQSANFIVETSDQKLAAQIAQAAEKYRNDMAILWIGQAMPNWSQPCMMTVHVGPHLGAGGATTFVFDHGEVFGWRMTIQGSAERIFDSVLPHEITHMVFASYFRHPLPRWADEGAATSVEYVGEKQEHRTRLVQFLRSGHGIPFNQMFAMTEYPADVMPLYAQGYSLTEFLIMQGGRRKFTEFLTDGMRDGQWAAAIHRQYGISDLGSLQNTWVNWVAQGFPEPKPRTPMVATNTALVNTTAGPAAAAPAAVTPAAATGAAATSMAAAQQIRPEPNLVYRTRGGEQAAGASQVSADATSPLVAAKSASAAVSQPVDSDGWRASVPSPQDARASVSNAPVALSNPPAALSNAPAGVDSAPSQVSRPQTVEPSRQIILEWNQPKQ
jgi:hypothetical protein